MLNPDVRKAISNMSVSELDELVSVVQNRRSMLNSQAAMTIRIGQKISFLGKRGRKVTGVVGQVMRSGKLRVVNCDDGYSWTLPATMATVVD